MRAVGGYSSMRRNRGHTALVEDKGEYERDHGGRWC